MLSILYVSSMYNEYSKLELNNLLNVFHESNKKHNVTGLMLYHDKNIIQYIEGDEEDINILYSNINHDKRHSHITTLFKQYITKRKFTDWKLEYQICDKNSFINFYKECLIDIDKKFIVNLFDSIY